jgi:antitoxin (DNA-binding transcriptional repressor) of toxin-antitoxin stability system
VVRGIVVAGDACGSAVGRTVLKTLVHEAKTNLPALVRAVEERGETVILQRHGRPVAKIHASGTCGESTGFVRELSPDPNLVPRLSPGYDPCEPLAADEWPPELR